MMTTAPVIVFAGGALWVPSAVSVRDCQPIIDMSSGPASGPAASGDGLLGATPCATDIDLYLHPRAPRGADDLSGGERPSPPDLSQQGR